MKQSMKRGMDMNNEIIVYRLYRCNSMHLETEAEAQLSLLHMLLVYFLYIDPTLYEQSLWALTNFNYIKS